MEFLTAGEKSKEKRQVRATGILLLLAAAALSIKYVFVDFGIDAEFQISMAYRLAKGDLMFQEMWEAYQMSAFVCAFFIKIYLALFGTTTGIVLYLQVIGLLIDVAIAFLLYRTIVKYLGSPVTAFAMAWVFLVVSPKDVPLPEYANMQVWFSLLLCIALFLYFQTGRKLLVVLGAVSLCAAVLSYPSCLILVAGVGYLFLRYSKKKDFFLFLAVCIGLGIAYLLITLPGRSLEEFLIFFRGMVAIETSHAVSPGVKLWAYLKEAFAFILLYSVAYLVAGLSVAMVAGRTGRMSGRTIIGKGSVCRLVGDGPARKLLVDLLFGLIILAVSLYTVFDWEGHTRYGYSVLFPGIILVGMRHVKSLSQKQFCFYLTCSVVSVLNFIATLALTDLQMIGSVPYLLIAVLAAFLPIGEALKDVATDAEPGNGKVVFLPALKRIVILGCAAVLVFRNVYLIRPMYLQTNTIFDVGGVVKDGPALGIFSSYMGPYMQNESIKEWREYVKEGSNIYLIGDPLDTLGYLYLDTGVAAPSTVCTPGYNENILTYWEVNPHKYPDVVIASCWYGELNSALTEDSWIMKWLEEEFQPTYSVDGKYWRYYFREE